MKKEYAILYEPVKVGEKTINKWNIEYYEDGVMVDRQHWSYEGEDKPKEGQELKKGYDLKTS